MAALDTRFKPGHARMAEIAVFKPPRHLVIMTHAAELALGEICHGDIVGAGAHFECELVMAHLATEANAVKPMGKNHWAHTSLVGMVVEHDVAVFRRRPRGRGQREDDGRA